MEGPRSACVQGQLVGRNKMLGEGVLEQHLEQTGTFGVGEIPADAPPAEDIDDYVKIEVGPFGRPHQLGDVPGPDLVGAFGEQFRLLINGMAELAAAVSGFVIPRGSDTWCGSSSGRYPGRAGWRRFPPGPGRRSAVRATGRAPPA